MKESEKIPVSFPGLSPAHKRFPFCACMQMHPESWRVCVIPIQVYSKCMRVFSSLSADMLSLWLFKLLLSLLHCFTAHWSPPAATPALPVSAICLSLELDLYVRDKAKATFYLVPWHLKKYIMAGSSNSQNRICWFGVSSCWILNRSSTSVCELCLHVSSLINI